MNPVICFATVCSKPCLILITCREWPSEETSGSHLSTLLRLMPRLASFPSTISASARSLNWSSAGSLIWLVCLGVLCAGCAHHRAGQVKPSTAKPDANLFAPINGPRPGEKLIVTPENGLSGKVVSVNSGGRFVVLNFPIGHMPAIDQRLNIYHLGLKAGEVKVSGPQRDDNIIGDLVAGNATVGDQVREQ